MTDGAMGTSTAGPPAHFTRGGGVVEDYGQPKKRGGFGHKGY